MSTPLPPVPQVIRIKLQGQTAAATPIPWANVLHAQYTGTAPSIPTLVAMGQALFTAWSADVAGLQISKNSLTEVDLVDLTSNTSSAATVTGSVPGTRGDDEIASSTACLVVYPIQRRYKGGHPRSYLLVGGFADFLDGAHWTAAFATEVITKWKTFLNAIVGFTNGGMTISNLVNVSYVSKIANPTPPYHRPVPLVDVINLSFAAAEQQVATQRRRIGRGRR